MAFYEELRNKKSEKFLLLGFALLIGN